MKDKRNVLIKMGEILECWKKNPGCDPDLEKYIELCDQMVDYLKKNAPDYGIRQKYAEKYYPDAYYTYGIFNRISKQISDKLLLNDLNINGYSPLYNLYIESYYATNNYKKYSDIELTKMLVKVSLEIAQGKRDVRKGERTSFTYNNTKEMNKIEKMNKQHLESETTIPSRYDVLEEIRHDYDETYTKPYLKRKESR